MIAAGRFTRELYFKFTILFLLFLLLAFDPTMAQIYLLIIIGDFIWFRFDPKITLPIEKSSKNRWTALAQIAIATAAFFILSTLLIKVFAVALPATMQATLELLATSTPVLQGNKFLTIMGWGVLIPIIETVFFNGTLFEGLASIAKKRFGGDFSLKKFNGRTVMVILVIATLFTLFHLTAKNLQSTALVITFIFSIISSILVVRNQHLREAIGIHICINTMAVMSSFGMLPF